MKQKIEIINWVWEPVKKLVNRALGRRSGDDDDPFNHPFAIL